jgi:2-polyprenyl-6-methoxyphenol hydroxylase-like FAD-dependent oxidoreductase
MEIYQQMELSDTIISDGAVLNGFYLYSNGSKKAEVEFSVVGDGISDFSKVFYGFEQFKTEGLLSENLKKSNNEVVWNTEFVSLEETLDYVVVTVRDVNSKEESTITAKYIVGCDGGRSPVRHAGKFAFEGGEYEKKFFVADIDVEWDKGNIFDPVKVVMEPADSTFIFFFPYKDENRYRAMGSLTNELNEKKEITDQEILDVIHQSSSFKFDIKQMNWHSTYKVHHRIVDRYNNGRIFLAGDAAHLHSPLGGQGMNTGLQDSHNLAWKLAMVVGGTMNPSLLETYNEERHFIAQGVVNTTDSAFSWLINPHWLTKTVRKNIVFPLVGLLLKLKLVQKYVFNHLSQVNNNYNKLSLSFTATTQKLSFKSGDRLPLVRPGFLNLVKQPKFHLMIVTNTLIDEHKLSEIAKKFPIDINIIVEKLTPDWQAKGITRELYLLVRPDQHIAYIGDDLNNQTLRDFLNKFFV